MDRHSDGECPGPLHHLKGPQLIPSNWPRNIKRKYFSDVNGLCKAAVNACQGLGVEVPPSFFVFVLSRDVLPCPPDN